MHSMSTIVYILYLYIYMLESITHHLTISRVLKVLQIKFQLAAHVLPCRRLEELTHDMDMMNELCTPYCMQYYIPY